VNRIPAGTPRARRAQPSQGADDSEKTRCTGRGSD
jgi:hypothetical protein